MKKLSITIVTALCLHSAFAQQPADLTVTLPTGKVITFQSSEQKAKYLAALLHRAVPAQPAPAQVRATAPAISLDAAPSGGGTTYATNWNDGYGYDISFAQTASFTVRLKNFAPASTDLVVRTYFFARTMVNNERFVFAMKDQPTVLGAQESKEFVEYSPSIQARNENYALIGIQYLNGSKYEGWLVQVIAKDTGTVVKQIGSAGYLEDLAASKGFPEMVQAYQQKLAKN